MNILKLGFWPTAAALILLLIIFGLTVTAIGKWQFEKEIAAEMEKLKAENSNSTVDQSINKTDLKALPEIVQLWLNKVGVVGKNRITAVNLRQTGQMKLNPEQKKWYKPEAEQFITVSEPGFLWQVDLAMLPAIKTKGRDLFYQGNASMLIKIGYLLPVVDQGANAKINESALHRFLLELPWYPTAALNDYLVWEKVDANTARATISYQGVEASADFIFDQEGNLLRTEAMRYKESGESAERLKCSGELDSYQEIDGMKIPTEIDVSWYLDSGKFSWFKVKVEEIEFEY
ncbi:hypothetical protein C7957_11640 [Halanaerobium saccharolyticum]|jgi:hypothetical protein|uniref:Uncharacterized protein n=1 Tax=Halanaerobium saccharolyticum TaxID=43595 RepID=A0A4R6RYU2_9FIRM|nr:DUF6544 family protein [Halanaerobium saccharolyticum]TDP91757.1 hypothetical protein C7957_11640 [Halanaerobium saccharolyticum]